MDATKVRTSKVCDCACRCRTIVSPSGGSCGSCLMGYHQNPIPTWVQRALRGSLPPKVFA